MSDVDQARAEFFRRTRRTVGVFYGVLGLAAAGCLAGGIALDAVPALLAFAAVLGAAVVLFALSVRVPTTARVARTLLWVAPLAGVVFATVVDVDLPPPLFLGGTAGFCVGMAIGIAHIRRRLARDDDLLRRQQRLGFEPERPWAWLRRG